MNDIVNILADRKKDLSRKYGREVDRVQFLPAMIETCVFMDKETFTFTSVVGQDSYSNKDGDAVRKWAKEKLKQYSTLVWKPVITVLDEAERNFTWNTHKCDLHAVSIDVDRSWVAILANGDVRMCNWSVPEEKRLTSHDLPWHWVKNRPGFKYEDLPITEGNLHVLPYTEEMWVALQQVAEGISKLNKRLHDLIGSKEGQARLLTVGTQLLRLLPEQTEFK